MNDPRLNSVHLEFPRREDFRRARDVLLGGRGQHTIAAELSPHKQRLGDSHTYIDDVHDRVDGSVEHWLIEKNATYPLKVGVNTIGRLPDNDVVIEGPYVSRRHCAILVHAADGCELYDIASKNGTFINGAKLSGPTHLVAGDEIRMCDRQFVFMSKKAVGDPAAHDVTQSPP
jgi:hypothetical protein